MALSAETAQVRRLVRQVIETRERAAGAPGATGPVGEEYTQAALAASEAPPLQVVLEFASVVDLLLMDLAAMSGQPQAVVTRGFLDTLVVTDIRLAEDEDPEP